MNVHGLNAAPPGGGALRLSELAGGRSLRILLCGELDLGASARVEAAIARALRQPIEQLELDLTETTFIDSSGVRTILQAQQRSQESGRALRVHRSRHPGPQRVFRTLGLEALLPWAPPALTAS